jgi:hypothetical protein
MALFGNFIVRFIMICIAFTLAVMCAGIFVGIGFYNEIINTRPLLDSWEEEMFAFMSVGVGFASTLLIGAYSYGVVAILIAIAELMRWKGMVTNLVMGGMCGLFMILTSRNLTHGSQGPMDIGADDYGPLLVALSAGFIGGFVYWLIAGRRAGDWLGSITSASSKS